MSITSTWMYLRQMYCQQHKLSPFHAHNSSSHRNATRLVNDNVTIGTGNNLDFSLGYWRFMAMDLMSNDILALDNSLTRALFSIDGNKSFTNSIFLIIRLQINGKLV